VIYLTTGTNGAGKTLFTLANVRAQQIKESRPVYFRGFKPKAKITDEFGWKPFEPEKWQELPDGSILLWDEAQEVLGTDHGKVVPQWVQDIAKYRRARGFDFWVVCPHPMMLHSFVRRLIEKPSVHRHFKRAFGTNMVSELRYGYVEEKCEKPSSGANAEITMRAYPKEVFDWYESASLHTVKKSVPRALWVMAIVVPVTLLAIGISIKLVLGLGDGLKSNIKGGAQSAASAPVAVGGVPPGVAMPARSDAGALASRGGVLSALEYVSVRQPRLEGLPQTAPVFDAITAPKEAPYPAACVEGKPVGQQARTCLCYTQQGTKLQTPADLCRQIVANGYFIEWQDRKPPPASAVMPHGMVTSRGVPEAPTEVVKVQGAGAIPQQSGTDVDRTRARS